MVHPSAQVPLDVTNASGWTSERLQSALAVESNRPFDLERGPLLRMHLFERPGQHVILTVMHHIAIDLWSMAIIMEETQTLLLANKVGIPAVLPPPPPPYQEFVEWEAQMLRGPDGERQRAYWFQRLSPPLPVLELPTDHPRPPVQSFRGKTLPFRLGTGLSRRLEDLARAERTTLNTLLLAAFGVLLHRYSGQDDVLVGTVMSGRTQPRFERVVGYLANPVVIAPISPAIRRSPASSPRCKSAFWRLSKIRITPFRFWWNGCLSSVTRPVVLSSMPCSCFSGPSVRGRSANSRATIASRPSV